MTTPSTTILVTGGTGTLGRDLIAELHSRGVRPRVLSRAASSDPDRRTGDLATGAGLEAALSGVDTVVHLAAGKNQELEAKNLLAASSRARISHLVFISIAGIDDIPLGYYRQKVAAERLIEAGPIPTTVQRTTQFHPFAANLFDLQRWSPLLYVPRLSIQPIDTRVVAALLADQAAVAPQGRMPDLGGPEILTGEEIAALYRRHRGWKRPGVPLALPGRTWAGFAAGHQLVPDNRSGGRTFAEFLADGE